MLRCQTRSTLTLAGLLTALLALPAAAQIPDTLPDPDDKPVDRTKPVKVFILLGQSNMVGMGDISGGSSRWGKEFLDPVVSVYEGKYSPQADYDSLPAIKTAAPMIWVSKGLRPRARWAPSRASAKARAA